MLRSPLESIVRYKKTFGDASCGKSEKNRFPKKENPSEAHRRDSGLKMRRRRGGHVRGDQEGV